MRRWLAEALIISALLVPRPSMAGDPVSTFGLNAAPASMAGASGASTDASSGPFSNPAATGMGSGFILKLGYLFSHPSLTYNGQAADVPRAHGLTLGLRVPIATFSPGGRSLSIALGVGLHVPDRWLARIYLIEPTRPSFVMWEGPVNRMVVTPVLAVAFEDMVALGAGVTLLADGAAKARMTLGYAGTQTRSEADLDIELRLRAAPVMGLLVHPVRWLTVAAGWTGELALDMDMHVQADLDAPGIEGDTWISIRGTNDYTPHCVWASLAFFPHPLLDLYVQGSWVLWSRAKPFFARMSMWLDLGGEPNLIDQVVPSSHLEDSFVVAAGVEGRIRLPSMMMLALRAGYQYRPTPVPDQTGFTSYADSDVHVMATGLGFTTPPHRPLTLTLGLAFQVQRLVLRSVTKDPDVYLSTGFRIEGWVVATMLDAALCF